MAKAGAQVVLISGYDGGTGAAPRTSIHHAGLPWELGLAETHQTLIQNDLRSRVVVETDGKLMSGRDVAIACMLGAEEFGFATAPLVTMGCVMMRVCNLDTCPVGVASQNPELRRRFRGKPEYVVNFMRFIAQELREHMARLGVRTVDELVGRTDLLRVRERAVNERAATVDLSAILGNPYIGEGYKTHFDPADIYDFGLEKTVDQSVLLARMGAALKKGQKKRLPLSVTSTDRAMGTMFGSGITRAHGEGLEEDTFIVHCAGGGGQSFGAFIPRGLTLELEGDSNDYFGKGLSGGKLVAVVDSGLAKGTFLDAGGKDVVIVGGGDTGNDCVGTAIRHGCRSVVQLEMLPKPPDVRGEDNPWPQWPRVCKTDYGQEEAAALFGADPRRCQSTVKECRVDESGALCSIVTVRLEPKEQDGRRIMAEVSGSEEELPCQLLLIAAGFLGPEDYTADVFGVERDSRSNAATAAGGYATGVDKVFAAGDMRRGQSLVVWAIAEGRAAAREVDEYLMGYSGLA